MNIETATPKEHFRRPGRYRQRTGQPIAAVSARIPDELLTKLANYGNSNDLSMSEAILELLERALAAA